MEALALPGAFARFTGGTDECWAWGAAHTTAGYGWWAGGRAYPHRVAYEAAYGPIPDGYQVHHECHNRECFNPAHLVALPPRKHREKHPKLGDACPKGHPYPQSLRPNRNACAVCHRLREAKRTRQRHKPSMDKRRKLYADIRRLRSEGVSRTDTAAQLETSVETVRRIDLGLLKRA